MHKKRCAKSISKDVKKRVLLAILGHLKKTKKKGETASP